MSMSRRNFLGSAAALGMLSSLLSPEDLHALQEAQNAPPDQTLPHDSPGFWNGFYDSVNPQSKSYGMQETSRGSDSLASPALETQYLHYSTDQQKLRYATSIGKSELLDHDGDVAVSLLLNQYRPGSSDALKKNASQLRVDTTQVHPFMNILAPLAWTAMASLQPSKAGKLPSLDQMGFKSDQVMTASSHILLTQGSGKIAVNISQAAKDSAFLKALSAMISGAKMVAPFIVLPAVSVPAMSAFSEAFSYWEQRTQFILNGNLVNAYATKQAMNDPELRSPAIGLLPGDYVVVAKKDTDALEAVMSKLTLYQGYLVPKDLDISQTSLDKAKSDPRIPDITYATIKVGVTPATATPPAQPPKPDTTADDAAPAAKPSAAKKKPTKP
jgi:hypothetical protein